MSIFDQIWRVVFYGSDRQNRSHGWWFENREREPRGWCCLQFVIEGAVSVRCGEWRGVVPAGGAFMFYYGEDSAYGLDEHSSERSACEWVNFCGRGIAEQFDLMSHEFGMVVAPEQAASLRSLAQSLSDRASLHDHAEQTASIADVYQYIGTMFSVLEEAKDTDRRPVDKAIHRVISNPLYPWSLKEVVKEVGCSREHFTRSFGERFGQSPADWLNQQRVRHALHLLQHSSLTIQEVAEQAGFSSTHTMARQLKRETGRAPSQLRSEHQLKM